MSITPQASRALLVSLLLVAAPSIFAAGGWYLLIPPRDNNDLLKVLDTKPLSQWQQQGAYDSASACEEVKNALLAAERNFYSRSSRDYGNALSAKESQPTLMMKESAMKHSNANAEALEASRCIKSDDPRLGK